MDSLPSPALSPENSPKNSPSTPVSLGRKRARSCESQASSSKRAMSEDPCLSSGAEPPQGTISSPEKAVVEDNDIESYMREQDEREITFEAPIHVDPLTNTNPSPPQKFTLMQQLKRRPMVPGETWYIISRSWYRKWEKACTGEVDKEGAILESQLGPVDNSSFFKDGQFDPTQSMIEGVDVEFVPLDAWVLFIKWYGHPTHAMPRQVITRGITKDVCLELRPLCFPIFRLVADASASADGHPRKYVTMSSQAKLADLYAELLKVLDLTSQTRVRTWAVDSINESRECITPFTLFGYSARLLSLDPALTSKTLEESLLQSGDGLVVEVMENGAWVTQDPGLTPTLGSGSSKKEGQSSSSQDTSLGPSPAISYSFSYGKGKLDRKGVVPGTIGFSNMGNTCFMNSALQCLAHAQELVEYFLTGVYLSELNPDNPLGMKGAIAEAFGALLNRVWLPQTSAPYAPREFKMQLQRFASQFSGFQQHDSQELVAFLLDGLHEDLNRVLKKPYVEKPDWHGGGDKELVMLAKESWEGYMKRNDSVIVDLFQGQYRSTLICPECNKVSITFDPFMYLTLPLPVQKKWAHRILYIPWDTTKRHVKVLVELNRNSPFRDVRQLLGRWIEAEPDNLLTLEIFSNRFYKYLDDTVPVSDMSSSDHIVCFELPCHTQQSVNRNPSADATDSLVILPVHLCKELPSSHSSFHRPSSGFAHPFIVVLDQNQVRDRRRIYAAVVERLERWTKHARDLYQWEEVTTEEVLVVEKRSAISLAEIKANGDVVTVAENVPEEGDITDEGSLVLKDDSVEIASGEKVLNCLGPKPELFEMHIQSGHDKLGANGSGKWERWETRENAKGGGENPALLFTGDALYCEWDDNFRSYFFGDEPHYEHALWQDSNWNEFVHPEMKELQEASIARKKKSISLYDCLEEFTKEEELGEDDLWYCPQCKKHQRATKKFDLWNIPDILVVHLKRFSNSRILRDKIDAFVDFPVDDLDLDAFSGEREVAKRLTQEGHDLSALGLSDVDEPLRYDLFAVDEHIGGLGGGHYRAYAKHHETEKWYHFDDAHVSPAEASDAVNQNAYLLFYKRRTNRPIGGKTYEKVQEARESSVPMESDFKAEVQLPTPPDDEEVQDMKTLFNRQRWLTFDPSPSPTAEGDENAADTGSDPETDPPIFEGPQFDDLPDDSLDPLARATRSYDFPNPESMITSPASSNAADMGDPETPDMDFTDLDDDNGTQEEMKEDITVEVPANKTTLHSIGL